MTVPTYNYTWEQGADLEIQIVYKESVGGAPATPKDLTGYSVRMDIRATDVLGTRIYTFNSDEITDLDGSGPGSDTDVITEITPGADGTITIVVPRSLTIQGGPVYDLMSDPINPVNILVYDIFLRNPADKQIKILSGTITVNRSVTLWT